MKKFILMGMLFMGVLTQGSALQNFDQIYPPVVQQLIEFDIFRGDGYGQFEGDPVAVLSDGSAWKIHPKDREKFSLWSAGDVVRIKYRTEPYWFKREHKFWLYNYNRGESCSVMIVQHKWKPGQLKIEGTETLFKDELVTKAVKVSVYKDGRFEEETKWAQVWEKRPFHKVLRLSDGSLWIIKNRDKFNTYVMGASVYVGAQGTPGIDFDFVLITGLERDAISTRAKMQ